MSHHGGRAQTGDGRRPADNLSYTQRRPTLSSSAVAVSEFSNPNLEPLFTSEQIQTRVAEMGAEIARDYAGQTPLLVGVLKGAYIFLSDLVRAIDLRLGVEFMAISSYGAGMRFLIVEDIVDTGLTLTFLIGSLHQRGAKSVRLAALLDKHERREKDVKIDYCGFRIPDAFVVGYGLDYAERYRNLPYIAVIKDPSLKD
jgi:hypoxanthine phosphoribosyltransferase